MQIVNLMTPDPIVINPDDTLANAKAVMDDGRFRRLPVVEGGQLVGILTERDIREHVGYLGSTRVNAAMRTELITRSVDCRLSPTASWSASSPRAIC
jgi:CBS domain-containing protein